MTKTTKTVYITSDKKEFSTEAEAQAHEIDAIAKGAGPDVSEVGVGAFTVANKDAILTILGARRRTRSDKGTKRKQAKAEATNRNLQDMKQ